MRRKKSLLIPAVLAFSLCTGAVVPVLAEETAQTADAADNEQEAHTQSATDTSDTPYEKGTITDTDFQSEWLNLKFTPPETVVMNTEEELQSVMKQGQTTLEEASGVELEEDALSGRFPGCYGLYDPGSWNRAVGMVQPGTYASDSCNWHYIWYCSGLLYFLPGNPAFHRYYGRNVLCQRYDSCDL